MGSSSSSTPMYRKSPAPSDERPRLRYQTPLPSPPRHLYRAAPSFPNPQASSLISYPFPLPLKIYPPNPPKITVLLPPMPKRTEAPRPNGGKKFRLIADVMRSSKPSDDVTENYYADVRCQQCRSGDRDGEMLLCDRCDLGYHLSCLRPIVVRVPSGPWFCPSCDVDRPLRRFPMMQTKIVDFFRIQKCADGKCGPSFSSDGKKRRRHSLTMSKRRRRILPYTPTSDPLQRLEQMSSLATALTTLNMEFSNDLTYMTGMAPKSANQAKLEKGGMQALAKEDKKALQFCRTMYKRGECPPLVVVFDSLEGFTVQAEEHIKDMTFISEYTGDVDYLQKREHDDCDSMMTLLLTGNSSQNLVICPDKRGNIARFINGINNHSLEGRKKQNLKCVRYNVDGECRVLLITCRDISPGERLYYDYNGYEQEYPTEHFV